MISYLGLGSNLDNRRVNLQEALALLKSTRSIRVTRVSPVYETVPVGGPKQPYYLNAAVEIETDLKPLKLLDVCLSIEKALGRTRELHWGPRTIDIDILLFDRMQMKTERLTIPHPLMLERSFVLKPLSDIAPQVLHPVSGKTIIELLNGLDCSGVRKLEEYVLPW